MEIQVFEKATMNNSCPQDVFYSIFDPPESEQETTSLFKVIPKKYDIPSLGPVLFSSKLQKKGQKVGLMITRHFFLFEKYLAYSSSDNPLKIKKFTELKGLKVYISSSEQKNPDEKVRHTITLFRSKTQLKLSSNQQELIEKWKEHLKKFCILTNFDAYYKRKDVLGKGAHGKVILASKNSDGKQYAVKIFEKVQLITQLKGFESIVNEIEILRKLDHRGIIKLYEVYESVSCVFLVLEYVQGGELYTKLKQKKVYPESQCIEILKNILGVLKYMHGKGIVHKDLKPENIVLATEETDIDIKLIDFGFACDLSVLPSDLKRCGTPGYVSPEVLKPSISTPVTQKADMFAVGAIFYQLLTGSKMFSGNTVEEILKKNKECFINIVKLDARKVSGMARDLLLKMLAKDPQERISASEALEHPFLNYVTASSTEIPDDTENSSIGEVSRYSFDMTYLKEQNICSRSKVCDSAGTFYITSHIRIDPQRPTWTKLHMEYEKCSLPPHHMDSSPKSIYSPATSNATSESSFENLEEVKFDDNVPSPRNSSIAANHALRSKKSFGSNTPTASPFHKAAILNNLKKSHMLDLKPIEASLSGDEESSGTFTEFYNKFNHRRQSSLSNIKRNSVA